MAKRATSEIVAIGLRLRETLRAEIERAAKERGVSMNAEIVSRLEDSFRIDETVGGAQMRDLANLMVGSFNSAGAAAAEFFVADGEDWRKDRICFLFGVAAVAENLMAAMPGKPLTPDEITREVNNLAAGIKARLHHRWQTYAGRKEGGKDG